ncbi:hypothetical protein BDR26DRAFT_869253 [Obelidium mucronatum]|nr:hypothetical protein BDR26DRAFT_869253 [Obelidium mucronatum]
MRSRLPRQPLPDGDGASIVSTTPSADARSAVWEKLVHRLFKSVPVNEPLFVEHLCAYQGDHILHQGKMYLTPNFFCFHANIFGYITTFEFPIQDILLVERAKTALIIPNAIIIATSSKAYFFTSFINRENALRNMEYLITRHRESSLLLEDNSNNNSSNHFDSMNFDDTLTMSPLSKANSEAFENNNRNSNNNNNGNSNDAINSSSSVVGDTSAAAAEEHSKNSRLKRVVFQSSRGGSDGGGSFTGRNIAVLSIMILSIALCMLLALGSTVVLWKIRGVIGRLDAIVTSL